MRCGRGALCLAAILCLGWSADVAPAQTPADHEARIGELENELAMMRARVGRQESSLFDGRYGAGSDGGWQAGAGVYYLRPYWETNPAYSVTRFDPPDSGNGVGKTENFDYSGQFAPLVWLGYVGESGLGGRVRFWTLSDKETKSAANPGPDEDYIIQSAAPLGVSLISPFEGDAMKFTSELDVTVVDLEATQSLRRNDWTFLGSCGVRYTRLRQRYRATTTYFFGESDFLHSDTRFEGVGPTGSLDILRQLGQSGFALHGGLRGSLLFGESEQTVNGTLLLTDESASLRNANLDVLPVVETEIGVQWTHDRGGLRFFVDTSLVAQLWVGAGNSANNEMLAPEAGGAHDVSDNGANLGFFGGKFSAGVDF